MRKTVSEMLVICPNRKKMTRRTSRKLEKDEEEYFSRLRINNPFENSGLVLKKYEVTKYKFLMK